MNLDDRNVDSVLFNKQDKTGQPSCNASHSDIESPFIITKSIEQDDDNNNRKGRIN